MLWNGEERLINVLGTDYMIRQVSERDNAKLAECDGYCDYTVHEIVIRRENDSGVGDFEGMQRQTLRHEVIHAFLAESGLQSSFQHPEFGHEETMVDWFAIQFPKLLEAFRELKILN